jgi:hypothetical protein
MAAWRRGPRRHRRPAGAPGTPRVHAGPTRRVLPGIRTAPSNVAICDADSDTRGVPARHKPRRAACGVVTRHTSPGGFVNAEGCGYSSRRSRVPALSSGLLDGNPPPRWGAPDEDLARKSGKRGSCAGQDPGDIARSECAVVVECIAAEHVAGRRPLSDPGSPRDHPRTSADARRQSASHIRPPKGDIPRRHP